MGTRGYRVFRFRGRYYRFYNNYDSYPEGLGSELVKSIPADPEAYQQWLAEHRKIALEWHEALERYLCLKPENDQEDAGEHPWGVATDALPNFSPAFNDLLIEWVYTIDLDNEVFTIDNGAHLHLNKIHGFEWIEALAHGRRGDRVLLPGNIPTESIADLVVKLPPPSASILELHTRLDVRIVEAKGLNASPLLQRHGPLLRAKIFRLFQVVQEPTFSAILLGWNPEEFPFRENAYAILCLASASLDFSLVPQNQISSKRTIGYSQLETTNTQEENEFLAQMGVGRHLEGVFPGLSPDSTMYWFDGVLVHLVAQLIDRPELVSAAVANVVEHCRNHRPDQCVSAILMSVEHIILMKVYPNGRVDHTDLLVLFDIDTHTSMNASGRYTDENLKEMQIRKKKAVENREAGTEGEDWRDGIEAQTCWPATGFEMSSGEMTEKSFMALVQFLETSTRQQLPPSRSKEGVFPTEIYEMIIFHLSDLQTHRACMQVSRTFRDLCQQNLMMMDDIVFQANDATRTYDQFDVLSPAFRMKTLSTGLTQEVILKQQLQPARQEFYWLIVVGRERNRRSLLPNLAVFFDPVE